MLSELDLDFEQALLYFSQEKTCPYLGLESSRWAGTGALQSGLSGPIKESTFEHVCQLVPSEIIGDEITFTAPITVSIAYAAGVKDMHKAHSLAIDGAINCLESTFSRYQGPDSILQGGIVAAIFDHATSPKLNPQLHSHVFIANIFHCADGRWPENRPTSMFKDMDFIKMAYRNDLIHYLNKMGFEIEFTNRETLEFVLKGIDPGLISKFTD